MKEVKLCHLTPNDYGAEMFVAAESKEKAFELFRLAAEDGSNIRNSKIDNLPRKYTIDEYNIGVVVETEIA